MLTSAPSLSSFWSCSTILYKLHDVGVRAADLLRAAVGGSAAVCDACGQL